MKTSNKELASIQLNQAIKQLEQLLFCDLVMTYNDYADNHSYERIYENDEITFNNMYDSAWDAVTVTNHKDYNDNDDYFVFNSYGYAISFSFQLVQDDNCPIDISELAQWIVDNDLFNDYDITVTTLDDMLASIEDNITDDENLLYKLSDYLNIKYNLSNDVENLTSDCMDTVDNYDYSRLNDIINHLGIDYQP